MKTSQKAIVRSATMRAIHSRNNRSTERIVRAMMSAKGLRGWRIQPTNVLGRPDFAFVGKRVAIFVDGCFWHGCPKCCRMPKSSVTYWRKKIFGNIQRRGEVKAALRKSGWRVVEIWEHELEQTPKAAMQRIDRALASRQ